ncbi:MAG TPA: hypothetical protein VML54_13105, partial [Candidatus Limnocylindrales bacterium]|nr:hypothetical protein [Candidatus Limnocylindrales bacterium]
MRRAAVTASVGLIVVAVLLLLPPSALAAEPTARVIASKTTWLAGDQVSIGFEATNPLDATTVGDLYFGFIHPDGVQTFFFTSLGALRATVDLRAAVAIMPAPPGLFVSRPTFLQLTVPAGGFPGFPDGTYTFFAALLRRSALTDGVLGAGDLLAVHTVPIAYSSAPPPSWLVQVNAWRAHAGLAAVGENPVWSAGDTLHGRYSVKHDVLEHD